MCRRRFPPWEAGRTAGEVLGGPQAPTWVWREVEQRGGSLTVAVAMEPKARHGRWEARLVWALHDPALNAYVGSSGEHGVAWPHLGQLVRVERWRTQVRRGHPVGKRQVEVTYYVTSAAPGRADAQGLQRALRAHWGIENGEHWVRDWAWDEDRCQVRSGGAPHLLAAARNGAMALLRQAGMENITASLRTLAARPQHAVHLILTAGRK